MPLDSSGRGLGLSEAGGEEGTGQKRCSPIDTGRDIAESGKFMVI